MLQRQHTDFLLQRAQHATQLAVELPRETHDTAQHVVIAQAGQNKDRVLNAKQFQAQDAKVIARAPRQQRHKRDDFNRQQLVRVGAVFQEKRFRY